MSEAVMDRAFGYIHDHATVREVVLSGGDPLLLENDALKRILTALRKASHVEVIRIHTRAPASAQRIEKPLAELLKTFHPVYINIVLISRMKSRRRPHKPAPCWRQALRWAARAFY